MSEWVQHKGNKSPVSPWTMVKYKLLGDDLNDYGPHYACELYWGEGHGPDGEGRISHYKVLG